MQKKPCSFYQDEGGAGTPLPNHDLESHPWPQEKKQPQTWAEVTSGDTPGEGLEYGQHTEPEAGEGTLATRYPPLPYTGAGEGLDLP